jgi:regulator of protease activity HflC (stomatin/prohibitin superfamily)
MNIQGRAIGIVFVILIIAGLGAATTRFAQVDEGQRGIIITQGAVTGVQEPGIFFQPFAPFTRVAIINVRRQSREISQNVASSDKQLYDIRIQVDYSRKLDTESLRQQYSRLGPSDEVLNTQLDGFVNEALKSASTQFTLDQALSDRGTFSQRIRQFLTAPAGEGQVPPVDQLFVNLEAVKVLDIQVSEEYAEVALTQEKGRTAAQLEAATRDGQVRAIQGRYWRENPELYELRKRELLVEMMQNGNIWFVDPNTNLTLLLNQMATGETATLIPQPTPPQSPSTGEAPVQPETPVQPATP